MKDINECILAEVDKEYPYIRELRRYFHQNPELSKQEYDTAQKIEEELQKIGVSSERVGETGVYAEIKGNLKGDKTIVLRADIDALAVDEEHDCSYKSKNQGVMHACGHDAHASALLGAARVLNAHKDWFGGNIRLIFQQGEEIGYGARVFIEQGYLDNAYRSFGVHVASDIEQGQIAIVTGANNASVDWFRIKVNGKGAHVSTPQMGADALYIASQIVVAVQGLITRKTSPMENVLIGIGKLSAGTAYNVVAQNAELEGTIRVFDCNIRKEIKQSLENLATSIAAIYGGETEIEWQDFTSPLINDDLATREAQQVAKALFGTDKVITNRKPSLGGDDMAEIILKVAGVYAYVGSKNPEIYETTVAHHNSHFDIDENCLKVAASMYVGYAIAYLKDKTEE